MRTFSQRSHPTQTQQVCGHRGCLRRWLDYRSEEERKKRLKGRTDSNKNTLGVHSGVPSFAHTGRVKWFHLLLGMTTCNISQPYVFLLQPGHTFWGGTQFIPTIYYDYDHISYYVWGMIVGTGRHRMYHRKIYPQHQTNSKHITVLICKKYAQESHEHKWHCYSKRLQWLEMTIVCLLSLHRTHWHTMYMIASTKYNQTIHDSSLCHLRLLIHSSNRSWPSWSSS